MTARPPIALPRAVLFLALALGVTLGLAACGKKGAPQAPGPKDQITYPRVYPPY